MHMRVIEMLEFFRPEQRVDQIAHYDKRHDQANQIFQSHNHLLQTVARDDVQPGNYENQHCNDDKYSVSHLFAPENRPVCQGDIANEVPVVWHGKRDKLAGK